MTLTPPFAYYGGKTTLAPRIAAALPPHRHYVEPFAGSLAVLLAKPRAIFETVNDLDGHLVTFWRVLRDRPDDLARVCALTPHSRADYLAAIELLNSGAAAPALDDVERARTVWVALTQGRGGTLKRTGRRHFEDPGARGPTSMSDYLASYVERMRAAAGRLAGVSIECLPALDVIAKYGAHPEVCIYADPPYLHSVRSSSSYLHEMGNVQAHRDLAVALHGCKAGVVLSGYHSPLYDDLFDGWHVTEFSAQTSQGNHTDRTKARVEVLWSNREPPAGLF